MARAIGYVRVSTDEQASRGHGLAAQQKTIRDACAARGWDLIELVGEDKGASGKSLERAGLQRALAELDAGRADVLVLAKLDRLSRSLAQGVEVLERAKRRGWSVVALDFGLDTTTPAGELVANVMLTVAQYERRVLGQRTKDGLAAARSKGVRLGRPQTLPLDVVRRIVDERSAGHSLPTIAAGLMADKVATARGGATWHASTVAAVLRSQAAAGMV